MKIWIISDTHCMHGYMMVPKVDMAICAGDVGNHRQPAVNSNQVLDFIEWFSSLNIEHKVMIAGNHDTSIEKGLIKRSKIEYKGITYLLDETKWVADLKIFGSPWTPTFGTGWAYNCKRESLHKHWDLIPNDADIVVTHGPPYDVLDVESEGMRTGCRSLLRKMYEVQPNMHIFGHIHEHGGRMMRLIDIPTTFINACVVDLKYDLQNHGIVIDYEKYLQQGRLLRMGEAS